MSEEAAEIALLHQMQQAGQDGGAWKNDDATGAAEGESPSNTENNKQEEVKREIVADDQVLRALSPSGAGAVSSGGDDYDPSSVTSLPAITIAGQEDSRSSSRASARKPKTVGGFIADDSDEEYDASTPIQAGLQIPTGQTSNRAMSPSPLQTSVSQQDLQSEPTNQGDSEAAQSSYALPVNSSTVGVPSVPTPTAQVPNSTVPPIQVSSVAKARLPHDKTGILEDRIKEDPRGDVDAWMSLIAEHRRRNKNDDARAVYERFFKVFPQAAEMWVQYIEMELELDNFGAAENIFGRSLLTVPNVQLWSTYLNYIRRRNDLTNDVTGTARSTISQAYDFVLANIGIDKDSGKIWHEYIQFIRSAPGQIGGGSWQDQQKMDQLRKAYQRAIMVPMSALNALWKDYDQFEMQLNKTTGRKFLQEKSPGYMTARSANNLLENLTRGLVRTTLPRLPPMLGFEGDQDYLQQVELWKKWLAWEQDDPLVLKDDDVQSYKQRMLYVYKQAVMALRFWPETWVDAAEWCYSNGLDKDGDSFLVDGVAANPESCLVAFKRADRLESTLSVTEADKSLAERGDIVRAPFDQLLSTLYELIDKLKDRKVKDLAKLDESDAIDATISAIISRAEADDDEEDAAAKDAKAAQKATQTKAIQDGYAMQTELLSRTISFVWIALMRAIRRVQGKGNPKGDVGGSRQIFTDARKKGRVTSDVYVAAALIEHHVYKDPAGTKIFERGAKLFPEDPNFTLEYLKHLLSIGDTTNARVTFEQVVNRLTQKPELLPKAKPLYAYFHKYESQYGELSQISKLEQRMAEVFPEDPKLLRFASRYNSEGFDPTAVRLIISPSTQMRPKTLMQSIEGQPSMPHSPVYMPEASRSPRPVPMPLHATNSPKRPFPVEELENELNPPRKLARGASPLKGAAGRRLDQQKRLQGTPGHAPPFVVPRDITFLLNIIPPASTYNSTKFKPDAIVRLLRETIVPDFKTWKLARDQSEPPPQRYDGRRSQNQAPGPSPTQNYQPLQYGGQNGSWPAQGAAGFPAPYAASPVVTHERDPYPAASGLPPRPIFQPSVPEPSRSGYYPVDDASRGGTKPDIPPQLWTAASWYP
ncbi:Suf-domain-containing protein [Mollisia scopiformis]|uniref:mRNA 3'-end-processing protein RNA14 n=1 Tax=Mollisia scopiformis TaxID=149040 RepID=A0A194WRX5_MOLSC|nr:Suf-domain-containing protein [Mollisia scopiformis]KUJ10730.1 Suf-domain-containing protein [Mollisia scopiformis]